MVKFIRIDKYTDDNGWYEEWIKIISDRYIEKCNEQYVAEHTPNRVVDFACNY